MGWDAEDVALLKKLWAEGQSAAQIAHRLGYSRNAVSAKLLRLGRRFPFELCKNRLTHSFHS
jgi:GcrA cell cycle regulator